MSNLSRRDALKLSLLTCAMPFVRHGDLSRLRSDRLRLGIIGVGNRGAANLAAVGHEHVVALCDVDDRYLTSAANQYQDAATFRDYREMLEADLDLDAVVVSTPDHTHAPASMAAMYWLIPIPAVSWVCRCSTMSSGTILRAALMVS